MRPHLSVVIPVFNEEKRINKGLKKLAQFLEEKKFPSEVLIVDDGSVDRTLEIARKWAGKKSNWHALRLKSHQGKGAAVKKGVLEAKGRYILFTDIDFNVPLSELERFLGTIDKADVVIASRRSRSRKLTRNLASQIFNFLVRILFSLPYSDTQAGFKLFQREAAHKLFAKQKTRGFCFDVEILYLAQRAGLKITELSVPRHYYPHSKVKIGRSGLRMFFDLIKIKWRFLLDNENT